MSAACAEIQRDAAALALVGDADAAAHAAGCPDCARALAAAAPFAAAVGAAATAPPAEAALVRAQDAVRAALARDRVLITRTVAGAVAAAAGVLVSGVVLGMAQLHGGGRLWAQAAVGLAFAVAAGASVLRLGARVVGLALLVSVLFAVLAGSGTSLAADVAPSCVVAELVAAAVALAPTLWIAARRAWPSGAGFLAAVAATGALAGQATLNLLCPVRAALPHLVVFHTGGVVLAAALGAALALLPRGIEIE
jgi:hypothetical protein